MDFTCKAASPLEFNRKDIWHIAKSSYGEVSRDNVSIVAAGVAFFALLALFPLITGCLSIYGYLADPASAQDHLSLVSGLLPAEVWTLINDQVQSVARAPKADLGLRIICSLILALWAAGAGIRAMMRALNIALDETETRNPIKFYGTAFIFTISMTIFISTSLVVLVGVPTVLNFFKLDDISGVLTKWLPWGLLIMIFALTNMILYRYGPSRRPAKLRWIFPGVLFATITWLIISAGFSYFVSHFSTYNATYGSLSAVIILLIWLWLTAFVVIMGAEINGEMERHTCVDTTRGPDRPIGQRGAAMADFMPQG
ncbi:MAG: YihY/virulence factor BrkB family protein [Maricaulaceae bacterium]